MTYADDFIVIVMGINKRWRGTESHKCFFLIDFLVIIIRLYNLNDKQLHLHN